MREAVIVSTARTPIGKAYRGGFNNLASPTLAGHAISAAVRPGPPRGQQLKCLLAAPHERDSAVHSCYAVEVLAHYNAAAGEIITAVVARRAIVVNDLAELDCTCGCPADGAAAAAAATPLREPRFDASLRIVERRVQVERDHPVVRLRH